MKQFIKEVMPAFIEDAATIYERDALCKFTKAVEEECLMLVDAEGDNLQENPVDFLLSLLGHIEINICSGEYDITELDKKYGLDRFLKKYKGKSELTHAEEILLKIEQGRALLDNIRTFVKCRPVAVYKVVERQMLSEVSRLPKVEHIGFKPELRKEIRVLEKQGRDLVYRATTEYILDGLIPDTKGWEPEYKEAWDLIQEGLDRGPLFVPKIGELS